ncbi:MAG TPA: lysylphosphatidylglycerol synthase transmembrane domain-containing protein [Terriglobia bacterium]|nr:lysylphosphatidylglycerol synthase transmembrane domain-containing protein [Terriglobia bacterium]
MTKNQRRWVGTVVVAAVLFLVFWRFSRSPDWRQFSWRAVASLVLHARPGWLLAALVCTYLSYVLRAYRWRFFLDPIKRASVKVLFAGQILGFSAVYLIGRPGEIVRPAYIARWERVTFASQMAIWLLERMYDLVAMALCFALALYLEPIGGGPNAARTLHRMHEGAVGVLLVTTGLVAALALFRLRTESLLHLASRALQFLPAKVRHALGRMARSFADGLDVVQNWRDLFATVLLTIALWMVNVSVFWCAFESLGGPLARLSWWAAAVTVFFAGLGLVLQLPGVGGGFQLAVLFALKQVFHIAPNEATSAALLQWLLIFVPCVVLGLMILLYGGLSFRKLEALAETESAGARPAAAETPLRES